MAQNKHKEVRFLCSPTWCLFDKFFAKLRMASKIAASNVKSACGNNKSITFEQSCMFLTVLQARYKTGRRTMSIQIHTYMSFLNYYINNIKHFYSLQKSM